MKFNYPRQLSGFYKKAIGDVGLKPGFRMVYLSLVQINSLLGWQSIFKSTLSEVIRYSGPLTEKEYYEAICYLAEKGYINYYEGSDGYDINILKLTSERKKKEVVIGVVHDPKSLPCRLMNHIKDRFPRVAQMTTQLSFSDAEFLLKAHHPVLINEVLEAMENTEKLLSKYNSVKLTCNNWCKIRKEGGWKAPLVKTEDLKPKPFVRPPQSIKE